VCLFGDGAVAEGVFHESLNLAALWRLPVLFVCENNRYAMGTALERHQSETDLAKKAASYRIAAERVDGMDVLAVEAASRAALHAVRTGGEPFFLEMLTYRFRAHSAYDPELYRSKEEVAAWRARDPIALFEALAEARGLLDPSDIEAVVAEVDRAIGDAVSEANRGTLEPIADLTRDVYAGPA
jgi:TPP-dependent pyruvate/acetoin dehydrogenase alpha subunit